MNKSSYKLFSEMKADSKLRNISPPIIIADNLRTPENIGMILRLAGNINAELALFISDEDVSFKESKIKRTSSGGSEKVSWKIIKPSELADYLPDDYTIIALETCDDSHNIFTFKFPEKSAIIVGNEVKGISDYVLQYAHERVFIPVPGTISSLNVTHALSIALFQWYSQLSS